MKAKASMEGSSLRSSPLSIIPEKIRENISERPVRKCFVARAFARSSRNCSIVSSFLVITTFLSWIVKAAIRIVMDTSSSGVSGTGGRRSGEPKCIS